MVIPKFCLEFELYKLIVTLVYFFRIYPSSNEVIQCTSNFFNRIRQLGKLEPLPEDISFKIELTYTNGNLFQHFTKIIINFS